MGWLQKRKSKKILQDLGFDEVYANEMIANLNDGYQTAKNLRNDLRKRESKNYKKLIRKINDISFEGSQADNKYERTVALVKGTSLSEWEYDDLISQIDDMYKELLKEDPYAQVSVMLNHIKSADMTKIHKIANSEELIRNSAMSSSEKNDLLDQLKRIYKL